MLGYDYDMLMIIICWWLWYVDDFM